MAALRSIGPTVAALAGIALAGYAQLLLLEPASGSAAAWMLLLGAVAAALAISIGVGSLGPAAYAEVPRSLEAVGVTALLGLAVWIRIAEFDRIPAGMNHDAAWNGMYGTAIRLGADFTPYVAAAWGRETLFMYLIAPFQSWLGTTPAAVQAASIAAGLAATIPVYLFARELSGRVAAFAALGFFAVSGWHWVFSQVGWRCVTVPPFETMALYFLYRALRRGEIWPWLFAGVFAGASVYTYNAARIVPAMIGTLALCHLAFERRQWRAVLLGGTLAAASFFAVASSMLWYAVNNWVKFQGRAAHLLDASQREAGVWDNLPNALWMFNYSANGNDFFVTEPLLEPLAAVLFVTGAILAAIRLREPAARFVLVGFLLALVPGLLSFPNGNRCITAMPFVYAIVGLACAELGRAVAAVFPSRARLIAAGVLAACMTQATYATYAGYLGDQRRDIRGISPEATAVGEYIARFGPDYRVFAVSDGWPRYTLFYLGYTHGNPLEPDLVFGRSFAEVENQINRYGRKGVVLVGDLSRVGEEARRGIKTIFSEALEESVFASRLGGREVARAVVVEPRAGGRTAAWSNRTRVVSVSPDASGSAAGAMCFAERPISRSFAVRFRLMSPDPSGPAAVTVGLSSACPSDASAIRFHYSKDGLAIEAPFRQVLVEPARLQAGRWHDVGFALGADGNASAMIDGEAVGLGPWPDAPDRISGLAIASEGDVDSSPVLYLDDFATIGENVPPDSSWWQVAPRPGATQTLFMTFEGLPKGSLAGRPGWQLDRGQWEVVAGPDGMGGSAVVASNGFDGGHGKSPGKFDEPMGVGVDDLGNIFVTERLNHRIQKFAPDGTYLGEWGVLGAEPGEFREPLDLEVDGDRVYVMDTWNTRLQVFDLTGNYLFQIGPDPALGKPRGIFVRDGKIYVANSGRDNILVYDTEGNELARFPPPQSSTLKQIVDVVADSKGRTYVNNSQEGRIEVFSPGGERVGAIEVAGWSTGSLKEFYMTIDDDDVIYISDWGLGRIRRIRTDGEELAPIGPKMSRPSGLAISGGRMIVAARGRHALQVVDLP